ncbi:HNH endonuclease [Salmonella enterica subsp. enterica]|nr:HNH endonuclease [Salmonella enterica subsp. enterica serovar Bovismorbificans]ECF7004449.1 HNH endonuclease [Salmonella enterica subsp. enterica serovar Bovismorbificans]
MKPNDMEKSLPFDELKRLLNYNQETGVFKRIPQTKNQKERVAGSDKGSEYTRICLNRKIYLAHRLAWYYMTGRPPKMLIDHINGNKRDNRFCNLRPADYSQNMMNSKISSSNKSGCKGVVWLKRKKTWRATGKINGKRVSLGTFKEKSDAIHAYQEFARKNHGEFYRTNID